MLLEKAAAKLFYSYGNLEKGESSFAMNLFTGAPSDCIFFKDKEHSPQQIFDIVLESFRLRFLMTTSTKDNGDDIY